MSPTPRHPDPETFKRLMVALERELDIYFGPLEEGFRRLFDLVHLFLKIKYEDAHNEERSQRDLSGSTDDILRSVVVFAHAYLEDSLRTLAAALLPHANENVLNTIPLVGLNRSGRAEKFLLGSLAKHRDKLVGEVIQDSIAEYLERSNFNSVDDIASLLKQLGFDPSAYEEHFPKIQEMMERRHIIVHRADKIKVGEAYVLQSIANEQVLEWVTAAHSLMMNIPRLILDQRISPESLSKKYGIQLVVH